jgi:GNAT superfamily N-acetyltransferase
VQDPHVLDLLAAEMLPAEETIDLDGWLVRLSPGLPFRRCNAVLPYPAAGGPAVDIDDRIAEVEQHYDRVERSPRFQLVPGHAPADLDVRLADRGYVIEAPVDVLVADPAVVARSAVSRRFDVRGEVRPRLGRDAAERLYAPHPSFRDRAAAYDDVIGQAQGRGVVAVARRGSVLLSAAFAVKVRGWVGIFGMSTPQVWRRQGGAAAVLYALASWAAEQGAQGMLLQVESDSSAALALYAKAGFDRNHSYHYRVLANGVIPHRGPR